MKTLERTDTSLVDILQVAYTLAPEEQEQIIEFGGNPAPEALAISLINNHSLMWTARKVEGGEPMAVGGFVRTGPVVFRSFFLANPRIWEEHGHEVTNLVKETLDEIKDKMSYVRLETYCLPKREKARKWYEQIGLKFDAVLKCFGVNGADAALYSTYKVKSNIQLVTADGKLRN